jgi:hypothetical protein
VLPGEAAAGLQPAAPCSGLLHAVLLHIFASLQRCFIKTCYSTTCMHRYCAHADVPVPSAAVASSNEVHVG